MVPYLLRCLHSAAPHSNKLLRSNIHNLRSIAMGWTITGNYCMKEEKN